MGHAALKRPSHMTVDEFLTWDDGTAARYELVGGEVFAMAPPSPWHSKITARLSAAIQRSLRPPCDVYVEAGLRLTNKEQTYYQADLAVSCTPLRSDYLYVPDPVLIVEVLSPSSAGFDRGTKVPDYRTISSVKEIMLVSSSSARVEFWRRSGEEWTVGDLEGEEAVLHLDSIGIKLPLAAIYKGMSFESVTAEKTG